MKNIKIKANFPLELKGLGIDKNPLTYFLTINVILNKNNVIDDVKRVQKELIKGINAQELIGSGIYKYPKNGIHFSIINFSDLSSAVVSKERFIKERKKHMNEIENILKKFDNYKIKNKEVYFAYIVSGDEKYMPESLAIQAYPNKELLAFFSKLKNELENKEILTPATLKCYCSDNLEYPFRFTVNLVRFFRKVKEEEFKKIKKAVEEINNRSKEGILFLMKLKHISFVLSDNWLSNEYEGKRPPEIASIELK